MKIAHTGSTVFLGKELLKILNDKKFNVKCYSLRNKEKIKLFLNDVSKVKSNVIINPKKNDNNILNNYFCATTLTYFFLDILINKIESSYKISNFLI